MANSSASLKQIELTRYAKAMKAAGVDEYRVDVRPDGTHTIIVGVQPQLESDKNDWDAD